MRITDIFKKQPKLEAAPVETTKGISPAWDWALPNPDKVGKEQSLSTDLSPGQITVFRGLYDIMPNPDPILKKLGPYRDVEAYKEILSDPQLYGAIENNRKPGVTSMSWMIETKDIDQKEIDFLTAYIEKLIYEGTFHNLINQSLDTPQFGRMHFGTVWNPVDGYWIPTKISPMPFQLCKFDIDGNFLISLDGVTFAQPEHPAKYLTMVQKPTIDNPYGEPLLSRCFWNARLKRDGWRLWAMFTEKFGMPWTKAKYNPKTLAASFKIDNHTTAADLLMDRLTKMARNGVIVFPDGVEVELTDMAKIGNNILYEKLIRICDEQNTKLQLGHSGATESTSGDKLSNDTTSTEVRGHIIASDKQYPTQLMNHILYWIHTFNFPGPNIPRFSLYKEEDVDLALAQRDAALAPVLMQSGLKYAKKYYISNYGFDDDDLEDVEIITPTTQPPAAGTKNHKLNINPEALALIQEMKSVSWHDAKKKEEYPDQQLIDDETDKLVETDKSFEHMLAIVEAYLNSKNDYNSAIEDLAMLFPDMNSKELNDVFEKVLFTCDVLGRLSVQDELGIDYGK